MTTTYATYCTDFYVNQKLTLKMDLPSNRETLLDLFDRIKKSHPDMDRFRRFDDEFSLESADDHSEYSWMALKSTSIRSGWVNPVGIERAYRLHQLILDVAPYFLSITPLDIEYLELVFGFDMEAPANRNEIVFDALLSESPLGALVSGGDESILDAQPFVGFSLNSGCDLQAYVEVKTRSRAAEVAQQRFDHEPISVYLTVRQHGTVSELQDLQTAFARLAGSAERLAEERVIPHVVMPIHGRIITHS